MFIPEIVTVLDTIHVSRTALTDLANPKAFGVVSAATVVTVKVPDTPPTVSTALTAVEN
ncbi:MAG TPA: hypothetical protein PKE27_17575 [Povalibacter sp.]|uniref:hypothetical protein n=1 Tax=Povalibacter sp. TaxID=1962978 RepID=UPI002C801E34|nr:hypothetical protein [Povalibacter sp.]HMN46393.1 hypothetical protein [Povalibacter sp.]